MLRLSKDQNVALHAEIMNKLMKDQLPHITNYFGYTTLHYEALKQIGQVSAASLSPSATLLISNAVLTEQAPFGSWDQYLTDDAISSNRALSEKHIVEILKQVAHGMVSVHANGIIHRSLSPRSIMVHELHLLSPITSRNTSTSISDSCFVKLVGFHRAKFVKEDVTVKPKQTSGLMPPEVAAHDQDDHSTWSAAGDLVLWCSHIEALFSVC